MVELAEMTARRRAPSSPRGKRRLRELRRLGIAMALLGGSSVIYLWLLLA
jgi:hypothetical protein